MSLNPASSRSPSGAAGGDLAGTYPDPTLAVIGSAAGPTGDTTHTAVVTIDAKGRVTALSSAAIAFPSVPVSSVFGRTGAVVAASNDYTFAQISGGASAVGGVAWTSIAKAGDTSRSTTTSLAIDPELSFTSTSGTVYEIMAMLVYASPAGAGTPDFKCTLAEDGTLRGITLWWGLSTSDAGFSSAVGNSTSFSTAPGTAAANRGVIGYGTYQGGGGTAGVYWAQNTSDSNATILRTGSILRYRAIG